MQRGGRQQRCAAAGFICSPFPARPYAFVMGSKIFTLPPPLWHLPDARRPYFFAPRSPLGLMPSLWGAKSSHCRRLFGASPGHLFAPPLPLSLVPSLWGAKSSHCRRLFSVSQRPGGRISLLPPSPLRLVTPLWGAKSSHCRRLFGASTGPGGCIYLLPLPR